MKLRRLCDKDIPGMLEWMHDSDINRNFRFRAEEMNEEKCRAFIADSFTKTQRHYCIADDQDNYQGTISLKDIDMDNKTSEYAVVMRASAIGTGLAAKATDEVLHIAHEELGLNKVYLNVLAENARARRFYLKKGFRYEGEAKQQVMIRGELHDLCWYAHFCNCAEKEPRVRKVSFAPKGDERGQMIVIEGEKDVAFDIKRIFYIYGSDHDVVRGQHANRKSQFLLINVSGTSKVRVDYGNRTEEYSLDEANTGLYIPAMVWKDMYDFSDNSVLLVLASELYDPDEYIRDKSQYYKEIGIAE